MQEYQVKFGKYPTLRWLLYGHDVELQGSAGNSGASRQFIVDFTMVL
jgi:hypothetical protein